MVTAATDAWGLGATLFEAATGVPPYPAVRPARELRRRLHPALADVIDACLSSRPEDRPGIVEIHDRLASVLDQPRTSRHAASG